MMEFLGFLTDNILRNPPILLGLIATLGLVVQRKNISEIIQGSLSAAFGMYIIDAGVGIIAGSIAPINDAFQEGLTVDAEVGEALTDVAFTEAYGGSVGLAMFFGLLIHLLIARFTPVKTIFLTGHMLWWFPFVFVAAGVEAGLEGVILVGFGAIVSALYWSFMPWIMRRFIWDVTEDDSFLIGHPTGILSIISGFVARKFGDKTQSTEEVDVPESLSFFRETSVMGGLVIFLMYLIIAIFLPIVVPEGDSAFFFAITQGISFGAGLLIMLYGVRLLINQIIPAFQGISEKIIPGAIPAFDVPILFNYKPNAVIIGFIVAMITSTILVILANTFNVFGVLLVPLVVTSFFEMGGAAVVGEGQGGFRGAVLGTIVSSFVMVLVMGISVVIFSGTIRDWLLIFGGNDFSLFGPIVKWLGDLLATIF